MKTAAAVLGNVNITQNVQQMNGLFIQAVGVFIVGCPVEDGRMLTVVVWPINIRGQVDAVAHGDHVRFF